MEIEKLNKDITAQYIINLFFPTTPDLLCFIIRKDDVATIRDKLPLFECLQKYGIPIAFYHPRNVRVKLPISRESYYYRDEDELIMMIRNSMTIHDAKPELSILVDPYSISITEPNVLYDSQPWYCNYHNLSDLLNYILAYCV